MTVPRLLINVLKPVAWAVALAAAFPCALVAAFGRFETGFEFFAQALALAPGLPGSYLRVAYYFMTLRSCSLESHIGMGSFFAHSRASVARLVYIGSFCVLGNTVVGERTQIASGVQVLSGKKQHGRDEQGHVLGGEKGVFEVIPIGSDCWIGAGAIVMAEVGRQTTIGAGSVVTRPIPARSVAVGNPARVIKSLDEN
jgi:virginiamycin A acetyltransferase